VADLFPLPVVEHLDDARISGHVDYFVVVVNQAYAGDSAKDRLAVNVSTADADIFAVPTVVSSPASEPAVL